MYTCQNYLFPIRAPARQNKIFFKKEFSLVASDLRGMGWGEGALIPTFCDIYDKLPKHSIRFSGSITGSLQMCKVTFLFVSVVLRCLEKDNFIENLYIVLSCLIK